MRGFRWIVLVIFCCPPLMGANYQKAQVVSMKTVTCDRVRALDPPGTTPVVNAFVGGAAPEPKDEACTAYELRTSKVVYHVMTQKRLILPVGETVQIRLTSRDMNVHTGEGEKDVRATILDMSLAEDAAAKRDAEPEQKPLETSRRDMAAEPATRRCLSVSGDVVPCSR